MDERALLDHISDPSIDRHTDGQPHALPRHRVWGGKEFLVLVVTPAGPHLSSIVRVLKNYGLGSRGFSDGLRAREWFSQNKEAVVAVVVDARVPILGGETLVSLLEEIKPGVPVALLSKTLEPELIDRFLTESNRSLFRKPVDYAELVPWLFQLLPRSKGQAEPSLA